MRVLSSVFLTAIVAAHNHCTMAAEYGACTRCGTCPFDTSRGNNFGCKLYGVTNHTPTRSVKKCMSQEAVCGGTVERCSGTKYVCWPGYTRPDGSSEYHVQCKFGRLDYGPACRSQITRNAMCSAVSTQYASPSASQSGLNIGARVTYNCKSGWSNSNSSPTQRSFVSTCVSHPTDRSSSVLSPDPSRQCRWNDACTNAASGACACTSDAQCARFGRTNRCMTTTKRCAECLENRHCSVDGSARCLIVAGVQNTCACAVGYVRLADGRCVVRGRSVVGSATATAIGRQCREDRDCNNQQTHLICESRKCACNALSNVNAVNNSTCFAQCPTTGPQCHTKFPCFVGRSLRCPCYSVNDKQGLTDPTQCKNPCDARVNACTHRWCMVQNNSCVKRCVHLPDASGCNQQPECVWEMDRCVISQRTANNEGDTIISDMSTVLSIMLLSSFLCCVCMCVLLGRMVYLKKMAETRVTLHYSGKDVNDLRNFSMLSHAGANADASFRSFKPQSSTSLSSSTTLPSTVSNSSLTGRSQRKAGTKGSSRSGFSGAGSVRSAASKNNGRDVVAGSVRSRQKASSSNTR